MVKYIVSSIIHWYKLFAYHYIFSDYSILQNDLLYFNKKTIFIR